jgi:hypothetical protein
MQDAMTDTITEVVTNFHELNAVISGIDDGYVYAGGVGQRIPVQANQNIVIDIQGTIAPAIVNTFDLAAFDNPLANVTIEGNGNFFHGNGAVSGFRVYDGNVTIKDLTVDGTVAQGGTGGSGLAGGGGGAGLGGAIFVGSGATVTLTGDQFVGNLAVGGDGGAIDASATASGGGGGLGGAGGSAGDGTGNQAGLGGGGGGGVGIQAYFEFLNPGYVASPGSAYGEASAGNGSGQQQNVEQRVDVLGWDVWSNSYQTNSGYLPGGGFGGQGGPGDSPESGGGGGGVGGQTSQYFNDGTTQYVEDPTLEFVLAGLETIGGILVPPLGVAEAATQLSADLHNSITNDNWSPMAIAAIAVDVITVGSGLKSSLASTEATIASELAQEGSNSSKVKQLFSFLSDLKPYAKKVFNVAGFVLDEVLNKDPQDRNLLGASYNFLTNNPGVWTPPPLDGQSSTVTMETSTAFQTNEPTAGGAGGWGGGGGGGVGGQGGFGGGGGGGGGPSKDEDFVGGNGGFGGGGGGGGINAAAGIGGWGAGAGTDGVFKDPDTGVISPMLGMGGGGLGAGGGVFVQSGGTLNLGGGTYFLDDAAQGGVAVNPGQGLGNDLFVQGVATVTFDNGLTIFSDGISGQGSDNLGLNIVGTGFVQLGGVNTFQGNITIGDTAGVANALQILAAGTLGFHLFDSRGVIGLNGGLEFLAGSKFSNSQMTVAAYTGGSLIVDQGAGFTGTLDLTKVVDAPFNLQWTPNLSATTADGIVPWNIINWSYINGVQSIDSFETPYTGDHYSVLKVDGALRLVSETSDGNAALGKPWYIGGQFVHTTTTELTLVDPGATQYTVHDDNDLLALNDVLAAEGASAPGAFRVDLDAAGTFNAPITLAPTQGREALAIHGTAVAGPIIFAPLAGAIADLAIDQAAMTVPDPDNAPDNSVFTPVIQGFGVGGEIDLTGLTFNPDHSADTFSISGNTLSVSNGTTTDELSFDTALGTVTLGSDGHGGTAVFASLSDAILAANAEPSPATGTTDLIILAPGASAQTATLPAIDLASHVQLTIDGPITGSTGLVLDGAGTVVLDSTQANGTAGTSTYSGGTLIESGQLDLASAHAAGSGAITFGPGAGTLAFDAAAAPSNQIDGFQIGQGILDFEGIGTATSFTLGANNALTISGGTVGGVAVAPVVLHLDPSQDYSKDTFILSSDSGSDGTFVRLLQTHFTVTDETTLNQAIQAIDSGGTDALPNVPYTIDFALPQADGHTLHLTSPLDAINLASGSSLTINGLDGGVADTIDGGGTERGLFVYGGQVSIDDLTIANAKAQGGAGGAGGGGGGAGLGGGLFVASGASVTLSDVSFSGDHATGGAGGGSNGSAGGGGGMGGAGGQSSGGYANGGGGGGIGTGANGGSAGISVNGGPGILLNLPGATAYSGSNGGGGAAGNGNGDGVGGGVGGSTSGTGGFGGGGGGGRSSGGGGGFGGGGGGGEGAYVPAGNRFDGFGGGTGGFGGGGGGGQGAPIIYNGQTYPGGSGGAGGFGAGSGGNNWGSGGGGLGAGGDIFVESGGSLTITGGALDTGTVNRSGGNNPGEAYGSGIFLQGNQTSITLTPGTNQTETIGGVIADMSGSVDSSGQTTNHSGVGSLVIGDGTSLGTVKLAPVDAQGNPIANTFTGGITLKSGTLEIASAGAAGTGAITFAAANVDPTLQIDFAALPVGGGHFDTPILDFNSPDDVIDFAGLALVAGATAVDDGSTLTFTDGGVTWTFDTPNATPQTLTVFNDGHGGTAVACYARGTLIATPHGEVPVEALAIGDRLTTASGASRPIKWIGTRSYGGRFIMGRKDILPICFKAGSLGDGLPKRDLWISPHHAMHFENQIGGVLIEAKDLINGVSIVQAEHVDEVQYFHIELETHDVILAEGAPSETFVDDDSRFMFHNVGEYAALYPEDVMRPARYCAPRLDIGYAVEAVRRKLAQRAGLLTADQDAGELRGYIDAVSPRFIEGWAQNIRYPEAPVCLDIYAGGQRIGQTLANLYREDLEAAGLGSGRHSFAFTPPVGLDFAADTVQVRRSLDGARLNSQPSLDMHCEQLAAA